ncbi:MAG TPA: MaoC/PaaZ C-terminal domain-containing protein [Acidimicrobiia bacterium]
MSVDDLLESPLGPFPFRVWSPKVAEFVEATGDDGDRWSEAAPPGFAAAALFAGATPFLSHPAVTGEGAMILHGEQSFRWFGPIRIDDLYRVTARLTKVRRRSSVVFLWLDTIVARDAVPAIEAFSVFLLARREDGGRVEEEPSVGDRGASDIATPVPRTAIASTLPVLRKSASRADLVRYAAASGDWNPIHWDHDFAVAAGQPGVICHGLLMASWVLQAAARLVPGDMPLSEARIRFKAPLRPAVQALVVGEIGADPAASTSLKLALTSDETEHVTATVALASW